jgi:hypothetical protein
MGTILLISFRALHALRRELWVLAPAWGLCFLVHIYPKAVTTSLIKFSGREKIAASGDQHFLSDSNVAVCTTHPVSMPPVGA